MDINSEDALCLYIEILSCQDLLIRDRRAQSSDPYIKVKLAGKDIHETKTIMKNLNPVFGDAQRNAFILDCPAKELFDNNGLLFKVKDYNRMSPDQDIGSIQIPAMEIYKASGTPMEFALDTPPDVKAGTKVGSLTIRCWPATESHLEKLGKDKKGLRGFVSGIQSKAHGIQHKVQSSAHDIQSKAKEKMQAGTSTFMDMSQAMTPPFLKKEDGASRSFGSDIVLEEEPKQQAKAKDTTPVKEEPKQQAKTPTPVKEEPKKAKAKTPVKEEPKKAKDDADDSSSKNAKEGLDHVEQKLLDYVNLVVEIVAGRDLLIGDKTSSDPYVKVMLGDKEIHKTKHLMKTLNPIYTPETLSTFHLDCPATDLSDLGGLKFIVKDWDLIGGNDHLGTVEVAYPTLVKGNGDAMEFMVVPPEGVDQEAGYLLIRFRKATKADEKALKDKKHPKNLFSTTTKEAASAAWAFVRDKKKTEEEPAKPDTAKSVAENVVAADQARKLAERTPDFAEQLHLKIEIVKCRGLLVADRGGTSDPYVKVKMGSKDLHETKHILKTLNPLFDEDTDSTFVLHCLAKDLYDKNGLHFKVKDWDRIGKNDELGSVDVAASTLYNGNGEDMEFKITPPKGKEDQDAGILVIRSTVTTAEDHTGEKKKFLGMTAPHIEVPKISVPKPMADMLHLSSDHGAEKEEPKPIFIEIVSCRDLLAADKTGLSDPYVKIKLGRKDLHETKHVVQTLDPFFEPKHNPYYVLEANPKDVRSHGGVTLKLKDYDRLGANDELGEVLVDSDTLYSGTGEKIELKLNSPKGKAEEAGFITIRVRPATEDDKVTKTSVFNLLAKTSVHTKDYGEKDLSLLIEIVSGWNLPIADLNSSDPYVKVKIGHRDVHRTKTIKNTRDPIYTIKHDSVFILDVATAEIKDNDGLTFEVYDYDFVGSDDLLAKVTVPSETVLEASGKRLELRLQNKGSDAGWLAIRCRPAMNYDREFLECYGSGNKKRDFMGLNSSYLKAMGPKGGSGNRIKALMTKNTKTDHGVKKYRVRPFPDPDRKEATEFMTEKAIEAEALKDSKTWMDVGSGDLGRVYIEILGADGLPNKDTDLGGGNKTDPFVAVVYEDCVAKTEVIDDCLSPRWLPWMQRAFIFRVMHPSSNLHIAVFDFDAGFANDHDLCGRVSIDLANLQPGTEYFLRYKLYENSIVTEREPKGIIMVRLRMELKPEKDMILSYFKYPPPEFYVNVKNGKDFDLVRQTVGGSHDLTTYSTKTIALYVEELTGHSVVTYYLMDSIVSLLFWRGQVRMFGSDFWFPLHSLVLFLSGITLAERPTLYPAFSFFFMGWTLLAVQYWRNNSLNPWMKSKTFVGLLAALTTGVPIAGPPKKIAPHEREEEFKAEEKIYLDRIAKSKKDAEERAKAQAALYEEHQSQVAQVGDQTADTNIATNTGGVSIDPLKFVLYPLQQYLGMLITALRFIKNVLIWDEPYIAFILTLAFFLLGFVLLFVPWLFLFRWTSRLVAWLLLGPHMKLVDIYWYQQFENMTEEERTKQIRDALEVQLEAARGLAATARIQREAAVKLKAIKKKLYGDYITSVPVLQTERFTEIPLYSSAAQPYKPPENQTRAIPERVAGQHLVGDMIPRVVDSTDDFDDVVEEKDKEESKKTN